MHFAKLSRTLVVWMNDAEGQALAEYGLILAVVVVAALGGLALIGGAVSAPFTTFVEATGIGGS